MAPGAVASGFFAYLVQRPMRRRWTGGCIERLMLSNARFGAIACLVGKFFRPAGMRMKLASNRLTG